MDPQTRAYNAIFASPFWSLILGKMVDFQDITGHWTTFCVQARVVTKPLSNIIWDCSLPEDRFSLQSSIISGQSCRTQYVHENPHFPSNEGALVILSRRRKYRLRTKSILCFLSWTSMLTGFWRTYLKGLEHLPSTRRLHLLRSIVTAKITFHGTNVNKTFDKRPVFDVVMRGTSFQGEKCVVTNIFEEGRRFFESIRK